VSSAEQITMRYEPKDHNEHYWVVLMRDNIEVFRFPYENMRHYADLYRMSRDAREYIMFWAKMIVDPD